VRREYADDYRGWPVAPRNQQHPIRGSFLDPRTGGNYHLGIDVAVRDDRPERGAPPGCSRRVFALEGGSVWKVFAPRAVGREGIVRIGHFGYGHVKPIVTLGERVRPGQLIAWTVDGGWHVHVSEWHFPGGDRERRVGVNPLARDGKIAPYVDLARPVVHELRFTTPSDSPWRTSLGSAFLPDNGTAVNPQRLSGLVDVRARIEDPQSFDGWLDRFPILRTAHHPARVRLTVVRLDDGAKVVARDVFTNAVSLGPDGPRPIPLSHHFAPGCRQNLRAQTALKHGRDGHGQLWFRLFARPESPYWDTTGVRNGPYRLTVTAWDLAGNKTTKAVDVKVAN
jgi:hypothetical protein